jgi:hypothetical protein
MSGDPREQVSYPCTLVTHHRDVGTRVHLHGCLNQGPDGRKPDSRSRVMLLADRLQGAGCRVQGAGCRVQGAVHEGAR